MNQVFLKTRELGEALLESEEYRLMKEAEATAMRNADAAETMGKYIECRGQIEELLTQDNPDSEALKRLSDALDGHQERLQLIDDVRAMTEARDTFAKLIEQVNQVLKFIITGDMAEGEEGGCDGSCGSCGSCGGGCHHHTLN